MAGRPTIYSEDLEQKAIEYILQFTDKGIKPEDEVIPSIEGLALWLEVNRDTLYSWEKQEDKATFSDIMSTLRAIQAKVLLNGSLQNKLNANISKALLSKHGYSEKTETESTVRMEVNNISELSDGELINLSKGSESGTGS